MTTSSRPSHFRDFPSSERPHNIWHFEELLPILDAGAQARVGQHSGYTPLIRADRLGAELGLINLYLKDDSSNRPSLSYKDRVVSMSVARPARARQGRDRLRLHRQRRHGRRLARGEGRGRRVHLLPQRAGGDEGARVHGARREGRAGRGQLRRSQPLLPRSSPKRRAWTSRTSRCARSTPRARRRRRSRSSSSSIGSRPTTSSHRPPAARSPRGCTRASASSSCSACPRPRRRRSTSPSRAAATRSPRRSSPRRPRSCR